MAYTKKKLQTLIRELQEGAADFADGEIDDSTAWDIADGVVFDEEGLKEYLETKGITDAIGYIANQLG